MKAKNVIACLLFCMIVLNGRVLAQQESLQGPQRMQRYVYDSEIYSNINGQGCVIKRDAGDLVYLDAALFRGEVKVEAGHVKIGAVPDNKLEVLPYLANPVLTNGLSLWLDSSRNVASDSGAVSSWLDVRDALGAAQTNFPWAALPAGVTAPTLLSSGIDFGESGSGSWLQWANTETNALRISDISTVVMAVSCENGGGCFLGDSVSSHFARGADTADGSRFFFRHGVSSSYLIQGDVYQDEKRVDALKSAPGSGPQVLSFTTRYTTGTADVTASNFGNDRNLERGGFTVYEVLVYNRVLKAAERIRVSEYLDGKWFGRSIAGDFEVHGAAELELAPTQNCALVSGRLAGSGTVVKSGAGSWVVGDADNSFAGQIVLQDGSITNASLVERSLPFAVSGDALSVVADSRGWRVADNQTAGVMEKSGNGEWLVTGVPQTGVQSIRVTGGALRLAGREIVPLAEEASGSTVVFSDSFEFPFDDLAYSYINSGVKYSLGVYGDGWVDWPQIGWTCRVNDPNTGTPRNPAIARCDEGFNVFLVIAGGNYDGRNTLLLSGKGEIRRMINIPAAGDYLLSFWAAARNTPACVNHDFDVCFGGITQTNILTTYPNAFRYYQVPLINVTAGEHELRFTGTNTQAPGETYRASVLDSISICAVADNGHVSDPGFEAGAWISGAYNAPTDGFWSFSFDTGWSAAISMHSQNLYKRGAPEGVKVAWMKNANSFAATNVTFDQAGTYAVSFLASSRQTSGEAAGGEALDGCWPGHDYRLFFNGVACGYGRTMNRRFERQQMMFDVSIPGTYTLRFLGVNEGDFQYFSEGSGYSLTRSSLFDSVNVWKVDSVPVSDYSFENNNTVNWKWLNNGTLTSASGNNYVPDHELPDGPSVSARAGIVMGTGQMYQDITFPEDGTYRLSFYAAGRFLYAGGLDPARATAAVRLGHDVRVCVDGETVMTVQTMEEIYHLYEVRLPVLKAGVHRLSFEGINTLGGTERGSSFDAVRLTQIETDSAEALLPSETAVEVSVGGVLNLDYLGTNEVKRVTLGGQECSGFITAERFPSYIRGAGVLYTSPKGLIISIR